MFTSKIVASLFLIATAGALNAGRGLAGGDAGDLAGSTTAPVATAAAPVAPNSASMGQIRAAVASALQARVRADLDDDTVSVDVAGLSVHREGIDLVTVDGQAMVLLGAGGVLPVRVEADWQAEGRRIDRLDYSVTGAATVQPALRPANAAAGATRIGAMLHAAIEERVGAGIGREFAAQHPSFQLVAVDSVASGRYRMVVSGTGITRFPGEGAAFTRFSASVGKFDGRVMHVDYELLQELEPRAVAAL